MTRPILYLLSLLLSTSCYQQKPPIAIKKVEAIAIDPVPRESKRTLKLISTKIHDLNGNGFYGLNSTTLQVWGWTVNGGLSRVRVLLDVDLSGIPSNAKIQKATITLFADTTTELGGSYYGHVQRLPSYESVTNASVLSIITSPWKADSITWNKAPSSKPSDRSYAPSASKSQTYFLDVTKEIKERLADPTSSYGWVLRMRDEVPYCILSFCGNGTADPALHPKMEIVFED